jgi:hypothetical protein
MTDKTDKVEVSRKSLQPSLPKRPSYDKVVEEIDKWANSLGLQKPK